MRKLFTSICCIILLFVITSTVYAASGIATLTPSKTVLHPGDTFTVEAKISDTDAVMICAVALEFDEAALTLVGGTYNPEDVRVGGVMLDMKAGTLLLKSLKRLSGTVFTFEFQVKKGAAPGTYNINSTAAVGILKGEDIEATGTTIEIVTGEDVAPTANTEATAPTQGESKPAGSVEPTQGGEATQPTQSSAPGTAEAPSDPAQAATEATTQMQPQTPDPSQDTTDSRWVWVIAAFSAAGLAILALLLKKKEEL